MKFIYILSGIVRNRRQVEGKPSEAILVARHDILHKRTSRGGDSAYILQQTAVLC